jgi:hypothetical protein
MRKCSFNHGKVRFRFFLIFVPFGKKKLRHLIELEPLILVNRLAHPGCSVKKKNVYFGELEKRIKKFLMTQQFAKYLKIVLTIIFFRRISQVLKLCFEIFRKEKSQAQFKSTSKMRLRIYLECSSQVINLFFFVSIIFIRFLIFYSQLQLICFDFEFVLIVKKKL